MIGCADSDRGGADTERREAERSERDRSSDPGSANRDAIESTPRVLFLGTSLTAGYGLSEDAAYPARLAARLADEGYPIEAINAGVSGDTSAGGLERLSWLLRDPPDWIFVELGANDGLRGLPVEATEANLLEVIERAQAAGAQAIVAGMLMPPNYGESYTRDFAALFPRVAETAGVRLLPFLLDGVAGDPSLNLPDGIHPNAEGHERIADGMLALWLEALGSTAD